MIHTLFNLIQPQLRVKEYRFTCIVKDNQLIQLVGGTTVADLVCSATK